MRYLALMLVACGGPLAIPAPGPQPVEVALYWRTPHCAPCIARVEVSEADVSRIREAFGFGRPWNCETEYSNVIDCAPMCGQPPGTLGESCEWVPQTIAPDGGYEAL